MHKKINTKVDLTLQAILQKRLEKDYSQDYVAQQLDLSGTQYGRIESGRTPLRYDILLGILEILGVDYTDFFRELKEIQKKRGKI